MSRYISAVSALVLMLMLITIPTAQAMAYYNCTGNHLITNITAMIDGDLVELWYSNVTCPHGCSINGVECNDPANVDKASVSITAMVFMALGIIFLLLSQKINLFNKKYYAMKYLYFAAAFAYFIITIGLLGSINIFGQDNIANLSMSGYYVLIVVAVFTFLVVFFTHIEEWYNAMRRALGEL